MTNNSYNPFAMLIGATIEEKLLKEKKKNEKQLILLELKKTDLLYANTAIESKLLYLKDNQNGSTTEFKA